MFRYMGLKFDQINEHLQHLMKNKNKIKRAWENSNMIHSHQRRFSKSLRSKCVMWIVM